MDVDLVIRNGRVIDPSNETDSTFDVAVKDGKVLKVGPHLQVNAVSTFDATDCIVTPGLIDAHVHCYQYATPLGVNPDETCLTRGVTTVVDAGSAGATTFMGLRKFIVEKSKTRVKSLLHIALHGLAASGCASGVAGGESDTLAVLDEEQCLKCIQEHRDVIVGVKLRLSSTICDNGKTENEAYKRALSVAKRSKTPLMVHHTISTIPTQKSQVPDAELGCPIDMKPGDIYTHTFHGYASTIIDSKVNCIHSDVINARSRGVLYDVGHGAGAFNWTVAELATKQKFWPDLIGTDLHVLNKDGPVYDLPSVMTKFLHLGMSMYDIIKAVTSSPARAYSLDSIGSLSPGKLADITVMKIEDCDVMLGDSVGQLRNVKKRILPVAVWLEGCREEIKLPSIWPNPEAQKRSLYNLADQEVKD